MKLLKLVNYLIGICIYVEFVEQVLAVSVKPKLRLFYDVGGRINLLVDLFSFHKTDLQKNLTL